MECIKGVRRTEVVSRGAPGEPATTNSVLFVTDSLARRLETAEAMDAAGCAEAQCRLDVTGGASVKGVAGGVAVFCGAGSPLTHALGLGMHGSVTADDLDEVEAFFEERGAPVVLDLCPHADPSFRELLSDRHYRTAEFINVMIRSLPFPQEPQPPGISLRQATSDDQDLYVRAVIGGFFGRTDLTEEECRLGATLFHIPNTTAFLADVDGQTAGGGGLSIRNKVASLFGDATLPEFRNRGVHTSVIRARLDTASSYGCDIATAGALPGSGSQRNYERLGFQIAYTKVTMVKA
jgi:GNAT superfamily N-acetyltransferase